MFSVIFSTYNIVPVSSLIHAQEKQSLLEHRNAFYFWLKQTRRFLFVPANRTRFSVLKLAVWVLLKEGKGKLTDVDLSLSLSRKNIWVRMMLTVCQHMFILVFVFYVLGGFLCYFFFKKGLASYSSLPLTLCLHEYVPVNHSSKPMWCFDVVSVCQIQ